MRLHRERLLQPLGAVGGGEDLVTVAFEVVFHELQYILLVVDEKYAVSHIGLFFYKYMKFRKKKDAAHG